MGFVKHHPEIEAWLRSASEGVRLLSDREYVDLTKRWRKAFSSDDTSRREHGTGAELSASEALPVDAYVFNMPRFAGGPAGPAGHQARTYAYVAEELGVIDFELANAAEAIIAARDLAFTMHCTHEAGGFAHPWFVRKEVE
jgi:hypothetical protein